MADWDVTAEDYKVFWDEWYEEFEIGEYISLDEVDEQKLKELEELDKQKLVWTNHGTCEDDWVNPGMEMFGDWALKDQKAGGCGCWQTYGFYIAKQPWTSENEHYLASAYLPCSKCNPDGESEEFDEDCDECEGDGFMNHYFD